MNGLHHLHGYNIIEDEKFTLKSTKVMNKALKDRFIMTLSPYLKGRGFYNIHISSVKLFGLKLYQKFKILIFSLSLSQFILKLICCIVIASQDVPG